MRIKRKNRKGFEVPSSSMSDISFILIVFFMVVSIFNVKEGINLNIPDRTAKPKNVKTSKLFKVDIVNNKEIHINGIHRPIEKLRDLSAGAYKKNPQVIALVRIYGDVKYGFFAKIISDIQLGGIKKLSYKYIE